MNFLTDEKLVIVGAGGAIGSNMVQTALMLGLTPNICLYDIFEPGVHGVDVEQFRTCHLLDAAQGAHEFHHVVAVVGAEVADVHALKDVLAPLQEGLHGIVEAQDASAALVAQYAVV